MSSDFACWIKVWKLMALILAVAMGLGLLVMGVAGKDGNGATGVLGGCCCCCGCCFFAVVRFLVDDDMLQG